MSIPARRPAIGDHVTFHLNDDLCPSPAQVINTRATTRTGVLANMRPHAPAGSSVNRDGKLRHVSADGTEPLRTPDSDLHVDLIVHGLVHTYRAYNIPYADGAEPGTWAWSS